MKEIKVILDRVSALGDGEQAVLATVVDLQGSGYRRPGARMLIKANGATFGTVSGGCLEADIMERAKRVLETGRSEVFVYDTTGDEDSVFSLNMGCRGVLRVLLEAVHKQSEIISALMRSRNDRVTIATAVVVAMQGENHAVGKRFIENEESLETTFPGLPSDLEHFRNSGREFETIPYYGEKGKIELAFETIKSPVRLLILGAGADAVPLADAAQSLGWQVKIYDHRPAFLNRERFAYADELVSLDRDAKPDLTVDDLTAIVAMNHNYERDKATLAAALRSNAFYVGALGPKKRTQQILDELDEEFDLSRLRSPAGLDIGADTPEAIAVSITAEIQSVLKHRDGGPLRDRQAPIYDRK